MMLTRSSHQKFFQVRFQPKLMAPPTLNVFIVPSLMGESMPIIAGEPVQARRPWARSRVLSGVGTPSDLPPLVACPHLGEG
jgi:hypothetical protein